MKFKMNSLNPQEKSPLDLEESISLNPQERDYLQPSLVWNPSFMLKERSCTVDIPTLMKKKIKFSSYIRKFGVEQVQSHIWGRASWYMRKCANISSYMRKPLVIYDFATAPFWISSYIRKIRFSFLSVQEWNPWYPTGRLTYWPV